ncbi:hypothetical protein [Roseovarius indicus]|uniref:hypothetical protein n=1 Tax=Roseovarius indicus TaxID=540747 RepID=UPI00405A2612
MAQIIDEDRLEDDLLDVAIWCEYLHPHARPLTLFVATQSEPVPGQLVIAIADTLRGRGVQFESPVVRDARRAMVALGYSFEWNRGGDILGVVEATPAIGAFSHHERLEIVARIEEVLT